MCSYVYHSHTRTHTHTHTLRLINGAEYLFSARDESEVSSWVTAINSAITHTTPQTTPTLKQTTSTYGINPLASGTSFSQPSNNPLSASAGSERLHQYMDTPPETHPPPPPPPSTLPQDEEDTQAAEDDQVRSSN